MVERGLEVSGRLTLAENEWAYHVVVTSMIWDFVSASCGSCVSYQYVKLGNDVGIME